MPFPIQFNCSTAKGYKAHNMSEFRRIDIHENLYRQLKRLKKLPNLRDKSIAEISKHVFVIPDPRIFKQKYNYVKKVISFVEKQIKP